ncbi:MAG: hypothetical protein H7Z37_07725 [Pyrinomonadaceae bacterium]|nr:hypothetical protein [Pyrinomonadaceae bacterium]
MKAKLLLLLILLTGVHLNGFILQAQTVSVKTDAKAAEDFAATRKASFEKVWNTINEKHFDANFNGVNWQKMREIYEPQALAATNVDELHRILQKMLDELKESHFSIIPETAKIPSVKTKSPKIDETPAKPAKTANVKSQSAMATKLPTPETNNQSETPEDVVNVTENGVIGIDIKILNEQFVVTKVKENSPAAQSGVKTGFVLQKINDVALTEILAPLEKAFSQRRDTETEKNSLRTRFLKAAFDGKPATKIKLEFLDAKDLPQVIDVERVVDNAEMSLPLGNFPAFRTEFESKLLENNIGYIRFNIWTISELPKIKAAIRQMKDAKGIIFDVRGNPGGIGAIAPGISGLLVKEQTSLGSMNTRSSEQKLIAYPQLNPFRGKIIVLIDAGSGSTSEIFAAGLQENNLATIIGERSAGMLLASIFDKIPTGAIFQYAIADYRSPKKILIEGRGVKPDVEIALTRQSLLAGKDSQIEAAIKEISNARISK